MEVPSRSRWMRETPFSGLSESAITHKKRWLAIQNDLMQNERDFP